MAIASPTPLPAREDSAEPRPSAAQPRTSRLRPWMIAPVVILALTLAVGGYYALLIRDAFSTIHTVTAPAASVSGSKLGGAASISIDTSAAKTAVAQAAAGIQTPTPDAPAAAVVSPSRETPVAAVMVSPSREATVKTAVGAPSRQATDKAAVVSSSGAADVKAPAIVPTGQATVEPSPAAVETATATATPLVTPSQIERMVNGDLEQGAAGWYLEDGATVGGGHVHSGSQALIIAASGGFASQRVFFVAGSSYQMTFWSRLSASSSTAQAAQARVAFRDAGGTEIDQKTAPVVLIKRTNWAKTTLTYTVPAAAVSVEITFWKPTGNAAAYFDDVSVRGLVSTETALAGGAKSVGDETNLLVMGVDARAGESIDSGVRPDSLMILHLDNKTGACRVLAIPRDTRTDLPGYGLTKINHALAVGGVDYEKLVVQNLLGIKIDHYVLIDFNGFKSLVDAVGGIAITVPDNFTATDGTVFTPGVQTMTGAQALSYARYRGGADGDFGRIQRQQQVLRALVGKGSNLNIVRSINELLPAVEQNLRTDLSARQMASIGSDFRSRCTDANVTMMTLDGGTATYQDPLLNLPLNYVILDPEEIKAKVAALLER